MAKETVLKDDADIYQKREEKTERQKLSEMSPQEKLNYFKDYYLKKILIYGFFIGFFIYIVYTIVSPKDENIMYAAIINDTINAENEELLITEFGELVNYNPEKQKMQFDDSYYLNPENPDLTTQSKITTYSFAGTLDVIIADEDVFESYAQSSCFLDLTQILPSDTYSKITQELYMTKTEEDTKNRAYGVRLDNSKVYTSISDNYQGTNSSTSKKMVLGIVSKSENTDVAIELIQYLFSKQ